MKARKGPEGGFPGMTVMGAYREKRTDAADALRAAPRGMRRVVLARPRWSASIMGLDVTATFQAGTGCFPRRRRTRARHDLRGADSGIGAVTRIEREARNMERYAASAGRKARAGPRRSLPPRGRAPEALPQQRLRWR